MEYRSTAAGQHIGHAIVAGAERGIGIELTPASTAGTALIQAVSDSTSENLQVKAKGAGVLTVGDSSNVLRIAASTLNFKGIYTSTFTAQFGAISSGQVSQVGLSTSVGTFAPGDLVSVDAVITPPEAVMTGFRLDSDASTRLTMLVSAVGSSATSTGRVVGRVTWLDLT